MPSMPEDADNLISSLRDDEQRFERMTQLIEDLLPTVPDEAARQAWRRYAAESRARARELQRIIAEGSAGRSDEPSR